jgi:hypothetical protein
MEEAVRAVYPRYNRQNGSTGERGKVCGIEGQLLARPVSLLPWKGLGRNQFVAAFDLWVLDDRTGAKADYGQACGPTPCHVALMERDDAGVRLVARGWVDRGCTKLDLAPYRMSSNDTLIGVRGDWMNHGFGSTTLTLLHVEGSVLRPVFQRAMSTSNGNTEKVEETSAILKVEPTGTAPNAFMIEERGPTSQTVERWTWDGQRYVKATPQGGGQSVKLMQARVDAHTWANCLDLYKVGHGRYPSTEQGLAVVMAAGKCKAPGKDPWARPYRYLLRPRGGPIVCSFGADGRLGGTRDDADICSE